MSDQPGLRDALGSVVPDPPGTAGWGEQARGAARRTRHRRLGAVVAAVVVVAIAVPVVRSLVPSHHPPTLDVTVHGTGAPACRQLEHHRLGFLADAKVVDRATAVRWTPTLRGTPPGPVTVCALLNGHRDATTLVAVGSDGRPVVVTRGVYRHLAATMTRLGELESQLPATVTTAPFSCPTPGNDNQTLPGSATLPEGATAVRICEHGVATPGQSLSSRPDVAALVRAINARPVAYSRGSTCAGAGSLGYTLVFDYPNGTRTVEADQCGWIGVGPIQRVEANPTIGDRFLAALARQEGGSGPTAPARCSGRGSAPHGVGDLTHVVAARFCAAGRSGAGLLLSPAQLRRLTGATDRYDNSTTSIEGPCPRPAAGWPRLMLSDAWHERFSVTLRCAHLRFWEMRFAWHDHTVVQPVILSGTDGLLRDLVHQAG